MVIGGLQLLQCICLTIIHNNGRMPRRSHVTIMGCIKYDSLLCSKSGYTFTLHELNANIRE